MQTVLLAAIGVGGASIVGALFGFIFKRTSHRFNDIILSFAAGVMLAAAIIGLILPGIDYNDKTSLFIVIIGIFAGALCINIIDKIVPHLHRLTGIDLEDHPEKTEQLNKILLFVIAIAIHNLPEGLATGVGFGSGDTAQALTIAFGIALQNIPEGMVIIAPMLATGISYKKTLIVAILTGFIEIIGTLIGFLTVSISSVILPFILAFAGGTMLYVISDEMIPETHAHGNERGATYSLLAGFCLMLIFDVFIG